MKNIDGIELAFVIFMIITAIVLSILAVCAYQDMQSRIKLRESKSLEMLEMIKREAVNEYISKQKNYETVFE